MSFTNELQAVERAVNGARLVEGNPSAGILPRLEVGKWAVSPEPGRPGWYRVGYITGASIDWSIYREAQSYQETILILKDYVDTHIIEALENKKPGGPTL
jgi:hypothetical protein